MNTSELGECPSSHCIWHISIKQKYGKAPPFPHASTPKCITNTLPNALYKLYYIIIIIYINKEELKTVGRDILACAQPNRHETFTAHWSPYRRVSLKGRRAQISFGLGARGEKPENDRPPFWFYGESIRTSVHGSHIVLWKRHHRNAIVGTNMKYLCM